MKNNKKSEDEMEKIILVSKTGKELRGRTDGKNVWITEGTFYNPTMEEEIIFLNRQPRGEIKEDGMVYFKNSSKLEVLSMLNVSEEMLQRHNKNWEMTISLTVKKEV